MMTRFYPILFSLMAFGAPAASAAVIPAAPDSLMVQTADTAGTTLGEVVVQGSSQRVVKYGVEYIPGKKVKKAAIDAQSLLFRMQVPQLKVSPVDNSITTSSDAPVEIYIDYVKASEQDAKALRPEDVVRVEVLDYPQDPRFNSASHVVNFIMQHYEWGGYTKLTAMGNALNDEFASGSVYEKFIYRNWTFDASASASGMWRHKYRDYKNETFRDFDFGGRHYDAVSRTSATDGFKGRGNSQAASLRAAVDGNNYYISHSASFSRSGSPLSRATSSVAFSDAVVPSSEAVLSSPSQSISCAVSGYYMFFMPKGNSLTVDWSFGHSANRKNSSYSLGNLPPIVNANREKVYSPQLTLHYTKDLGHNNSLRTMLSSYAQCYHTRYAGTYDGLQKLISSENMLFLEYMQNWGFGLSLYSRVGASYVLGRLNGVNILKDWNPRLGLQLQYRINAANSISLDAWWANSHPQVEYTNTAFVQSNELLWVSGNPDMKNIYGPMLNLSYNLIPARSLSLSASLKYEKYANMPVYRFFTEPGHDGLIRTYSDDNDEQLISASVSASLRLLNNSLMFYASGEVKREIRTGLQSDRITGLSGMVNASYYIGNVSMTLYYMTPTKSILNTNGYLNRYRCSYGLIASYATGDFKAEFSFRNWFSNGRVYRSFASGQYSSSEWNWVNGGDRLVNLTLSYTFPYGKKVNRSDDLRNEAHKKSAILEY